MKPHRMAVIYPVVMPVPAMDQALAPREKTKRLSVLAREALSRSATKSGVSLDCLEKDDRGAPLPFRGIHWSISHKRACVSGVAAPAPVGIDIERIRPISEALFRRTADSKEWALGGGRDTRLFFRYWTAKEAVLKATGAGFREFSQCRIAAIVDENILGLWYRDREWRVAHHYFSDHVAAVVADGWEVIWSMEKSVSDPTGRCHISP